ncbi:MAG TPA: DUF6766 family protein [Frankiaceae bacterium]|jgi:hypothetical protein|nr:DUF6766 family protein [Frankiaceae bacterium]
MRKILRENSLSLALFFLFFTTFLVGQTIAGHREYNADQRSHQEQTVSYGEYLHTAHFGEATFENWESEFLQMGMYVLLTVFLVQKGSAESKDPDKDEPTDEDPRENVRPDSPWPVKSGGVVLKVYEHSLTIALFSFFLLSMLLHAWTGAHEYSNEQAAHGEAGVGLWGYLTTSRFWFESFQNWQSEFLAVAAIVVLTIFLRERGSSESKPVAAPHAMTGTG